MFRGTEFRVASASPLRDFQKSERSSFADGRRYGMALDPVALKVAVGDWQAAVVVSAVVPQLDFDPVNDAPRRQA
jgi:hypothetical protein